MKMKLITLSIPEDLDRVPEWLEGHLLGLDLHQVVTELLVMGGASEEPTASLADVLGDKCQEVLQLGLRSLSRTQLRQLVRRPQLLLELQNLILDEGGSYWTTVPQSDQIAENTKKTWANLQVAIAQDSTKSEPVRPTQPNRNAWLWASTGWLAATAATIVFLFIRADRIQQLEDRLTQQSAELNLLRKDHLAQQNVKVIPADLPDGDERFVNATADPNDLPGGDPLDLPEIQ